MKYFSYLFSVIERIKPLSWRSLFEETRQLKELLLLIRSVWLLISKRSKVVFLDNSVTCKLEALESCEVQDIGVSGHAYTCTNGCGRKRFQMAGWLGCLCRSSWWSALPPAFLYLSRKLAGDLFLFLNQKSFNQGFDKPPTYIPSTFTISALNHGFKRACLLCPFRELPLDSWSFFL